MTNKEKFKEVFGIEPDTDTVPIHCEDCKYNNPYGSCSNNDYTCESWWDEEYKELKNAKPAPILKDAPHIVSIFSCPHYLPCGWCDKRDMLCNQIGGKI